MQIPPMVGRNVLLVHSGTTACQSGLLYAGNTMRQYGCMQVIWCVSMAVYAGDMVCQYGCMQVIWYVSTAVYAGDMVC